MGRYIQYYDNNGFLMLGSSGYWRFDNRMGNKTALSMANARIMKQSIRWQEAQKLLKEGIINNAITIVIKPRQCQAQVMCDAKNYSGAVDQPETNFCYLDNLIYVV